MTDRLGEQGAIQYAQNNPTSAGVSRLGGAGALQAAIADALSNGLSSLNGSRLGGKGRIYALAAGAGPMFLFNNSEVGVWYDPSDFSTLFQDNLGTTPVTAVGQAVGLMLDKSNGLVLGPEKIADGAFDTSVGWTLGTWTISGGTLNSSIVGGATGNATYASGVSTTAGVFHKITFTVVTKTSTQIYFALGSQSYVIFPAGTGTFTMYLPTTGTDGLLYIRKGDISAQVSIDNLSVKKLSGYHATQSTSTARGLSGTNLVDLDGVDDSVTIPAGGGGSTGFFLCTAVRVDGGAGTNRVIYSDAGTNTGYILRINASNQLELAAGNGTAYTLAPTTATLTAGPYVVTAWDDGTNLNVQVDGGAVDSVARPVVSAGNADFRIGKDYGAATGFFNGAIYPYVYVKNAQNVDANDRAAIKSYIASKAGVSI